MLAAHVRALRAGEPIEVPIYDFVTHTRSDQTRHVPASPVVIVDTTLRSHGLGQPKRSQPTPNGIRVEFENVAFDKLVVWLGDLSNQYGMEVQAGSLSAIAQAGPGRVNASLTLERTL